MTICHAHPADSVTGPWVAITVDVASVGYQHSGHESEHDGDIIPPYEYTDADGQTFSYPGKGDQPILAAGCVASVDPSPTPTPTPDPSPSPSPTADPTPPGCRGCSTPPPPVDPPSGGHHGKPPVDPARDLPVTGGPLLAPSVAGIALALLGLGTLWLGRRRRV